MPVEIHLAPMRNFPNFLPVIEWTKHMFPVAQLSEEQAAAYWDEMKTHWLRHVAARRQAWRARTHCPQGHEMVGDNVYMSKDGYKKCRPCRSASAMRFRPKKPESYELKPEAK